VIGAVLPIIKLRAKRITAGISKKKINLTLGLFSFFPKAKKTKG